MKSRLTFFTAFIVLLLLSSCGPRSARMERRAQGYAVPDGEDVTRSADTVSVLDRLPVGREPYRLCSQELTSEDGMDSAFPERPKELLDESTPIGETFYSPTADIRGKDLVRTAQLRYNYIALYNRVIHSYEWYVRVAINIAEEEFTRRDTLYWIRYSQPKVSRTLLDRVLPDPRARTEAGKLLQAYSRFDGVDREGSPFDKAVADYSAAFEALPRLVSQEEIDRFGERFWDWYDKRAIVPVIDDIIRMNMRGYGGKNPTRDQINHLRQAVETEKDIDRRTILALEYVKFSPWDGVYLLGEILESRIYTKYLLEAWNSWRSNVQMNHSPSSFSVIANNYYDRLRVICIDTMVRHCLECDDPDALCLLENLILCDIIHRMDSIAGNGSFGTVAGLSNGRFIHPRILTKE